jgi:hypothetical protein
VLVASVAFFGLRGLLECWFALSFGRSDANL